MRVSAAGLFVHLYLLGDRIADSFNKSERVINFDFVAVVNLQDALVECERYVDLVKSSAKEFPLERAVVA